MDAVEDPSQQLEAVSSSRKIIHKVKALVNDEAPGEGGHRTHTFLDMHSSPQRLVPRMQVGV